MRSPDPTYIHPIHPPDITDDTFALRIKALQLPLCTAKMSNMPTDFDAHSSDMTSDHPAARSALLAELESYEHLLFEPMAQRDLDGLLALQTHWEALCGDSPAAIALTEALSDWIDACVHETDQAQAWQALINAVYDLALSSTSSGTAGHLRT